MSHLDSVSIRQQFFDFFEDKGHKIVPSAPIVNKDDPSLMFINAGMNQFKEYFLGNKVAISRRVADTQKCLRVSGKHNDLDEVGRDSYHHTMFEMLGNWSFGDYFKREAISWAWELLTDIYKLDKDRLYVSIFEGDESDGLKQDQEAFDIWAEFVPKDRILSYDKKDNFWEMGAVGPCGPCSEIHIDLRDDKARKLVDGKDLVNMDDPLVVEIWNLVFIQYERMANGDLVPLPEKHVDTGMGFERLCMAVQGKKSNYDTDVFTPYIDKLEKITGLKYEGSYEESASKDIAFRVVSDHLRAISFAIADGQLPSNTGAGYVIRRILRRAVRYGYSFLGCTEPFIHKLVTLLSDYLGDVFPEISKQKELISKVIFEEEKSFLKTLEAGLKRFEKLEINNNVISGKDAFELYDTYGFPIDLTKILAEEQNWKIDEDDFIFHLKQQKNRSKADAKQELGDWTIINDEINSQFVGYDDVKVTDAYVLRYRSIKAKDKILYQVVINKTPFYPEGGGQVGDQGNIKIGDEVFSVINTKKEHDLIVHYLDKWPDDFKGSLVTAEVNETKRRDTEKNHSATHLLHAALRSVLGKHVEQKGSLVIDRHLRFDFTHFAKLTDEELKNVELLVNKKIRESIPLVERRDISIDDAKAAGAMMLFGEKYGEKVRMISFDKNYSNELCGGCHVNNTGEIGWFRITSETAIAAGIRRIEAKTGLYAEMDIRSKLEELNEIKVIFKNTKNVAQQIVKLKDRTKALEKSLDKFKIQAASNLKADLLQQVVDNEGVKTLIVKLDEMDSNTAKNLIYQIEKNIQPAVIVFGLVNNAKPQLMIRISESITDDEKRNAGKMIRSLASFIQGGGGGQAFFATAGGKNVDGLDDALNEAKLMIK